VMHRKPGQSSLTMTCNWTCKLMNHTTADCNRKLELCEGNLIRTQMFDLFQPIFWDVIMSASI
jgi:hypothetical protein